MHQSNKDDFEQIFEELEEYQEFAGPEEAPKEPLRHIDDPTGSPPLFTIADVLGWVLAFFVIFIIYTTATYAYNTFDHYASKAVAWFDFSSNTKSFESPAALPSSRDEASVENERELSRIEDRIENIRLGISNSEEEELEAEDEVEEEAPVAQKKKKRRFSIREFFGKTVNKDIVKNRDKVFSIGDRSKLENVSKKEPSDAKLSKEEKRQLRAERRAKRKAEREERRRNRKSGKRNKNKQPEPQQPSKEEIQAEKVSNSEIRF